MANPRTTKPLLKQFILHAVNSSRLPQSVFSPKPCRRDHVADASLTILGIHRRNIIIFWNFNMRVKRCGFWLELYLTILDALHRFREVPQGALL